MEQPHLANPQRPKVNGDHSNNKDKPQCVPLPPRTLPVAAFRTQALKPRVSNDTVPETKTKDTQNDSSAMDIKLSAPDRIPCSQTKVRGSRRW